MLFNERIKQLCEQCQLQQRKIAEALDIDTATYCKVEKCGRHVKTEQIAVWLADKVISAIMENK
ncbi:MAG: hypothetical protein LBH30_01695 [Prevotellaceae bacterium]|jgi:DNA-binding XRE family transcriptional regulator|nr:hypothetical protein [Prevotellaceae bacterium]